MIICCPHCQTKFKLPESKENSMIGSRVKCCRCEHIWTVQNEDIETKKQLLNLENKIDDLPPAPLPEPNNTTKKPRKNIFFTLFLIIGITGILGWIFILRSPSKESGIESDLSLSLSPLESKIENGEQIIIVRGHIVNQTNTLYRLPEINIVLLNQEHTILETKKRLPPIGLLGPKRDIIFTYTLKNPPKGIYKVEVNFELEK
ncbi:MAG: zinc-ribbon domain-containing protein [Alphaproteobacteria bacterium]